MKLSCETVARAILGEPPKRRGAELLFHCSCSVHQNGDRNPSLAINPPKNTWFCEPSGAGGNAWQLAAFLARLDPNDKPGITAWLRERGLMGDNGKRIVAAYQYQTETCEVLYEKVRYEPKSFRLRRPDGNGGFIYDLRGVKTVLYNLPEVLKAKSVLFLEALRGLNVLARVRGWDEIVEAGAVDVCWHCHGERTCRCISCAVPAPKVRWDKGPLHGLQGNRLPGLAGEGAMNVVPKLADLIADPDKVSLLPPEAIPTLLGELERLRAIL